MIQQRLPSRALLLTVNYTGGKSTEGLIESLRKIRHILQVEVIVVDNASGDDSVPQIRAAIGNCANFKLIQSQSNRGYFGGARLGLQHFQAGNGAFPDWIIVCNNDIEITDQDFFERLFEYDPESVGVIGPRIVALPWNIDQNPFMQHRPGRLTCARIRLVNSNFLFAAIWHYLSLLKRKYRSRPSPMNESRDRDSDEAPRPVYAVHGSFFVFSRRFFEAGGYLDENLFLYGEEISVAEIARMRGLAVVYDPRLRVWHKEHGAIGNRLSRLSYHLHKKACEYVLTKYFAERSR